MTPARTLFGVTADGIPVEQFTLTNARGMAVSVIGYGGIVVSLRVPDRNRHSADVVLGFDSLEGYLNQTDYFGALIGRCCNRIANGRLVLDGRTHQLSVNAGPHHLHGGFRGFDKVMWQGEPFSLTAAAGLRLTHTSPDGEEGYPGNLQVRTEYLLTEDNELIVSHEATTDAATPVNLTQHSCFNLAGAGRGDILGHELMIEADQFTPVDRSLIPTGDLAPVEGTPFDFRRLAAIGSRIEAPHPQLQYGRGYDHNFVLRRPGPGLVHAARVVEPLTGRTLDVFTTQPGLQLYTGNFLDGTAKGKGGARYGPRAGFCLETQHYPDSPNHPAFPSIILREGQLYRSRTVFAFGVAAK
jgi:aldose 1-epimerase